jgi:cysteinyl-tRNA synthetase
MSLGSAENYRYYWQTDWRLNHPSWIKKKYEGYDDEYWVEFWEKEWQDIIYGSDSSYLNKIINAGFDGVYLDNVEAYYFLYHND